MDDAEYIFRTDAKEKKNIARSARNKVTHSGCKLPSDYLTAKQKRQLNGEVITVNMNKPVAFKAFKLWPKDIQEEYLNGLIKTYGVGRKQIASMMGVTVQTIWRLICDKNLAVHFSANGKYPNYDPDKWEKFCNNEAETDEKPVEETNAITPEETYEEKHDRVMGLLESGMITVNQAADMLGIEFKLGAGWDVDKLNREKLEDARQQVAKLEEELGQAIDYSKNPDGEIVTYCENDARSTKELHRAFKGADVVTMSVSLRDVQSLEDIIRYLQIVNWPEKNEVTICIVEREVV